MFRPWRSAALPLAAIVLLGAACSDDPSNAPPTNPPEDAVSQDGSAPNASHQSEGQRIVAIIGDSITVGSQEELVATMPLDDVEVIATSGIRLGPQREAITFAVAAQPDVLVIELGTNDVPMYTPEFLDAIDEVLDETDALPCVRWVTVYVPGADDAVEAINEHLDDATDDHDNLELIDWFTLVDDDPSLLSADGLHPNEEGQQVLADAVAASVARCDDA
jgi:hypothetical protein